MIVTLSQNHSICLSVSTATPFIGERSTELLGRILLGHPVIRFIWSAATPTRPSSSQRSEHARNSLNKSDMGREEVQRLLVRKSNASSTVFEKSFYVWLTILRLIHWYIAYDIGYDTFITSCMTVRLLSNITL